MAVLLSDDFTRADSTTVPGSPTIGGPYTVVTGTWGINTNRLYTSASTANSIITFPAAADLTVKMDVTTGSFANAGLIARYQDASNWVGLAFTNISTVSFYIRRAGASAVSGSSISVTVPATLQMSCFGPYIYGYVNNSLRWVIEEPFLMTATTAGVFVESNTVYRMDNLYAETLAAHPSSLNGSTNLHVYKGRDLNTDDTGGAA